MASWQLCEVASKLSDDGSVALGPVVLMSRSCIIRRFSTDVMVTLSLELFGEGRAGVTNGNLLGGRQGDDGGRVKEFRADMWPGIMDSLPNHPLSCLPYYVSAPSVKLN